MPGNGRHGRWLRLVACACWVIATAAGSACAHDDPNVIESFEVATDRSDLLLPVWFEGHELLFILDTGSSFNVVDSRHERALVPTGEKARLNGNGGFALYRSPDLSLGKARIPIAGRAIMADLAHIREVVGRDVRGILGMQFLGSYVVQIDYDAGRVAFLKTSKGVGGQRISIYRTHDGRPAVTLELPVVGNTGFLIDTGMGGWHDGTLSAPVFDEVAKAGQLSIDGVTSRNATFEGEVTRRTGILASQTLLGNRHAAQQFAEGRLNALGVGYLSRYKLTFDFRRRVVILEKGRRYDWSTPVSRAGIDVAIVERAPTVREVEIDGAAWKCGIRAGDRIVGIDDDDARRMTIYDVIGRLEWQGTDSWITVADSDGGNVRRVNLWQRR